MKKVLSLLAVVAMLVSFCACDDKKTVETEDKQKTDENSEILSEETLYLDETVDVLHLWNTASTDVVDFSIDEAKFTFYASATHNGSYLEPTDNKTVYAAPTGKSIVVISFTVGNKDRAAKMSIGDALGSSSHDIVLNLDWKIKYNGKEYKINGLKDSGFNMSPSVIINRHTQKAIEEIDTSNQLLFAGRSESYRVAGIVDFEPESLDDTFEIQVSIPDSKGKYTKLTYVTEYDEKAEETFYNSGMELFNKEEYGYAIEKFKLAGDFPGAKEKHEESQLMHYLFILHQEYARDYFKENKDSYELLNSNEINSIIVGKWKASSNYGKTIEFCENGIIENEYVSDGTWKISGDFLEYQYHDKDTVNICEMRKIKDDIYMLYKDGEEPVIGLQVAK